MKEPVVMAHGGGMDPAVLIDNESGWKFLFLLGAGLMVIGLIDVGMAFFPPQWASLSWEFGTVSGVIQSMPLLTMGIGTMTAASVANGWRRTRGVMVALTLLASVVIALLVVVFALDVPPVLRAATEPALKLSLKYASLKTGLMAGTYFVLYLALGVWTWRRLRTTKSSKGMK